MTRQGFDLVAEGEQQFTQFCERIERTEEYIPAPNKTESGTDSTKNKRKNQDDVSQGKQKNKKARKNTFVQKGTRMFCLLHGPGTHSTDACNTLKAQAERMKATYNAQSPGAKKAYKKKEELNALIALKVQEALKESKTSKKDAEEMHPAEVTQQRDDDTENTESSVTNS